MLVWPLFIVMSLPKAAPDGTLSSMPLYTPGIDTVPPLRMAWIACRKAPGRSCSSIKARNSRAACSVTLNFLPLLLVTRCAARPSAPLRQLGAPALPTP